MDDALPDRVVVVNAGGAGRRLDAYLALRFSDWTRSQLARSIREGLVRREGRPLKASTIVREGDTLFIGISGLAATEAAPPLPPVLFEDDWLLAVDKPAGLLMNAAGQRWSYGLVGLCREARPDRLVEPAHRLDRETSGVVVLTLNATSSRRMSEIFTGREVHKRYLAIVRGSPDWEERICEAPLGPAGREVELAQGVVADGVPARTDFRVLQRMASHALVECRPLTGRTHQIRAHLAHLGWPILGDKLYGQPDAVFLEALREGPTPAVRAAVGFPRQALHAAGIRFPHPEHGEEVAIEAPLPADMAAVVEGAKPGWAVRSGDRGRGT